MVKWQIAEAIYPLSTLHWNISVSVYLLSVYLYKYLYSNDAGDEPLPSSV